MKNTKIIGLCGVARSGKDTFCNLLIDKYNKIGVRAKRFALADRLKEKVRQPLRDLSGIDILNCNPSDKELVRDYLVSVGKIKRIQTQGKYWTSLVEEEINSHNNVDVAIITDIRYDYFREDEVFWVKNKMKGKLIHISRYYFNDIGNRVEIEPANSDESLNNPKLLSNADCKVEWETTNETTLLIDYVSNAINQLGV